MITKNTRDSQNCNKAIPLKSSPYQRPLQVIKVFQRPSICLTKMSCQNATSKYRILYFIYFQPWSINAYFLYFLYLLYFLPSSIIHCPSMYTFFTFCTFFLHPSMYTFFKIVNNKKGEKNSQKHSKTVKTVKTVKNSQKRSKTFNNGQQWSNTVKYCQNSQKWSTTVNNSQQRPTTVNNGQKW